MTDLPCPILKSLDVAEELLEKYRHLHASPESILGLITLTREATERMHAVLPCQPAINHLGRLACSLDEVTGSMLSLVFSPPPAATAVQLDAIVKGETAQHNIGLFL